MTVAVRLQATVTGHRRRSVPEHELALALPPGPVTAHQLIEAAVRSEISAYAARADEARFVRVLTERELLDDLARGSVRMGDAEPQAPVDADHAVTAALLAFDDGLFKVFVGDDELEPGSTAVVVEGARIMFLRLVPLAGG